MRRTVDNTAPARKTLSTAAKIIIAIAVIAGIVVTALVVKAVVLDNVVGPETAVERLADAYNDRSMQEIVECFDPDTQGVVNGVLGIAEAIMGVDNTLELADSILQLSQYIDDEDLKDFQNSRLEIKATDVQKDGDRAIVSFDFTMYCDDEIVVSQHDQLPVIKDDGVWYIDGTNIDFGY